LAEETYSKILNPNNSLRKLVLFLFDNDPIFDSSGFWFKKLHESHI